MELPQTIVEGKRYQIAGEVYVAVHYGGECVTRKDGKLEAKTIISMDFHVFIHSKAKSVAGSYAHEQLHIDNLIKWMKQEVEKHKAKWGRTVFPKGSDPATIASYGRTVAEEIIDAFKPLAIREAAHDSKLRPHPKEGATGYKPNKMPSKPIPTPSWVTNARNITGKKGSYIQKFDDGPPPRPGSAGHKERAKPSLTDYLDIK